MQKQCHDTSIMKTLTRLSKEVKRNNYKVYLASLELQLADYYKEFKEQHPVEKKLLGLYERLYRLSGGRFEIY